MNKERYNDEKVKNFYYLLAYAFKESQIIFDEKEFYDIEEYENIYDLFSIIIELKMRSIIQEGIYNEYVNCLEESSFIKGRIRVLDSIKCNSLELRNNLICEYQEYQVNNYLNQIVKTTIYYLLKKNIQPKIRLKLKRIYSCLENIEIIFDYKNIKWDFIIYNRLNQRYSFLIKVCEFVFKKLIMNKEKNNNSLERVIDNQEYHELFENFLVNYLEKYYTEYSKNKNYEVNIKKTQMKWNIDKNYNNKNEDLIPKMHTDITISYKNRIKIIDAKFYKEILSKKGFKGFNKESVKEGNLYQIYSYITNMKYSKNECDVSGMILYAQTPEEMLSKDKLVDVSLMGNRIKIQTVDFTLNFGDPWNPKANTIVNEMKNLAEDILNELMEKETSLFNYRLNL